MGRIALIFDIWTALNAAAISASTSDCISSSQASALSLTVNTNLPVQTMSYSPPVVKAAVNVCPYSTFVVSATRVVTVTNICTRTYYHTFLLSPSTTVNYSIQCTVTVTRCDSNSRSVVVVKQANIAAGVVGGLIGGSVIGFVLTVVITAITAILITKHHKKGKRCHQSRYL